MKERIIEILQSHSTIGCIATDGYIGYDSLPSYKFEAVAELLSDLSTPTEGRTFREVKCSERLPEEYGTYLTNLGELTYSEDYEGFIVELEDEDTCHRIYPKSWLEKIPSTPEVTEEEIDKASIIHGGLNRISHTESFKDGAKWILNLFRKQN